MFIFIYVNKFLYSLDYDIEKVSKELLSVNDFICAVETDFKIYHHCFYSRVSVMRGQVITPQGLGIVGIRVSVDKDARFGFTLTRTGGW